MFVQHSLFKVCPILYFSPPLSHSHSQMCSATCRFINSVTFYPSPGLATSSCALLALIPISNSPESRNSIAAVLHALLALFLNARDLSTVVGLRWLASSMDFSSLVFANCPSSKGPPPPSSVGRR